MEFAYEVNDIPARVAPEALPQALLWIDTQRW